MLLTIITITGELWLSVKLIVQEDKLNQLSLMSWVDLK